MHSHYVQLKSLHGVIMLWRSGCDCMSREKVFLWRAEYFCLQESNPVVITKMDVPHLLVSVGDGGDESHPSDPGLHVLLSRHH